MRQDYLQRRVDALQTITARYETDLEALLKKLTQNNDLDGALFVRKELEASRGAFAQESQADLKTALLATNGHGTSKAEKGVAMTFQKGGSVSHIGMHGKWQITGPREVTITESTDGHNYVLRFNSMLSSYDQAAGPIHGRRWK